MSKTKNKGHSEVEHLRGLVREYEKEIRSLQKQVRSYEKYERRSQDSDIVTDTEDTHVELKMKKLCFSCGKNYMVETLDLGARGVFGECICGAKGKMN